MELYTLKYLKDWGLRYGSEPTDLNLPPKADEGYCITEPLAIYEMCYKPDNEPGYYYCVRGVVDRDDITESELIELLESFMDEED